MCVAACNSAFRLPARQKFPEMGERRAGYQLAFEAKVYDLRERRYEQFTSRVMYVFDRGVVYLSFPCVILVSLGH